MTADVEYKNIAKLAGKQSIYFRIPSSIILDKDADDKRVSVFSFFSVRRGLDNTVTFTVNGMAKWLGRKPDRHAGGTNDKLSTAVANMAENGYVLIDGKVGNSSEADATFNCDVVARECDERYFAVVYLDELRKILEYSSSGKDSIKSVDSLLLVFSYLRMKIPKRRNRLFAYEGDVSIEERMKRNPEAYDCFCYEIAEDVGLSDRTVSKAVKALEELGLICSEQLPRTSEDGKWRTNRTIFCNCYKRENGNLIAYGSDYYAKEIANKKKKLKF